jgi:hypothetical protein
MLDDAKPDRAVFFLPGIMGSTLRFQGDTIYGEPSDEVVWDSDVWKTAQVIRTAPSKLRADSSKVKAEKVIQQLKRPFLPSKDIYGKFIKFCTSTDGLALKENIDFFTFPYDWRMDNRDTAALLADQVHKVDPEGKKRYYFFGHSMGGLITRLMLQSSNNQDILKRTKLFIQIASPVTGSAKAFSTLKKGVSFGKISDEILKVFQRREVYHELRSTLENFPSLFQLVPMEITIVMQTGHKLSPLVDQVWPQNLLGQVEKARLVHKSLANIPTCKMHCFYAKNHKTADMFVVDPFYNIQGVRSRADGDGTVTVASATTHSGISHLVEALHDEICSKKELHNAIKSLFEAEEANV